MRRFILAGLLGLSTATAAFAETQPMRLSELLKRAEENNPDIQAAYRAWKAEEERVAPAGSWPAPSLRIGERRDPSGIDGVELEPMRRLGVEQMIPFPGKLTTEARMKRHEAALLGTKYQIRRLETLGDVRRRFYQLYLTDRSIDLADQSIAIMKSVLRSAQARLASGQTSASDVFMAQTELRRMENMAYEQTQERRLIQAELNALLNEPPETPLGAAQAPELLDLPVTLAEAQALAMRFSPEIQSGHHERNHSQSMLARGRLEFAPDFSLMYDRMTMDQGPAGREVGLSISFPLWFRKPWGQVCAAKEHALETEQIQTGMANMVRRMVTMRHIETETHLQMVRNHLNGILPAAQSNLTIVRQQYSSGQTDFMRFLESLRGWIGANLDYEKELYRYGDSWTGLERWIGTDLKTKEHSHE